MFFRLLLIFAAFGGFLLAFYIRHKKRAHEKMICPLNSDCDAVVYSEYSKFLGVPVELLGLFYYGLIAVSYGLFVTAPPLQTPTTVFAVLTVTVVAFLFSLYLTLIQAFALKQWCAWCLTSAGICAVIFFVALGISEFGFVSLLRVHRPFVVVLHSLGVALGVGGATIADILFFKFLKDFRVSEWEAGVMRTLSQVIWFATTLLILTGLGLYLPAAGVWHQSAKFLVKAVVAVVIVVNGVLLNLFIAPKLVKISFGERHQHQTGELRRMRRAAFALGAASIVSWYSAFLLGMLRDVPVGFKTLLAIYLLLLAAAVAVSQFYERSLTRRAAAS